MEIKKKDMEIKEDLYREVTKNFTSCLVDEANVSEIWKHTLTRREIVPSFEKMVNMLAPGSNISSLVDDMNYLIDASILDMNDPIEKQLLTYGQNNFGNPRKDLKIGNNFFGSHFIHHLKSVSTFIKQLEKNGIRQPRIMEIGGGTGEIQYLLTKYFKENLTLYIVDIPEMLLIQNWFLRNCFPKTPFSFIGGKESTPLVKKGFNFINANILKDLKFEIDGVVNIDSMQEMSSKTVNQYLHFIEQNITQNGVFFFQNHHGHSSESISEPTEYPLDEFWELSEVKFMEPFYTCSKEILLRIILKRIPEKKNCGVRKFILRALWNGFLAGYFQNSDPIKKEMIDFANKAKDYEAISPYLETLFRKTLPKLSKKEFLNLSKKLYVPRESQPAVFSTIVFHNALKTPEEWAQFIMIAQKIVLDLLIKKIAAPSSIDDSNQIYKLRNLAVKNLIEYLPDEIPTEYWAAYASGILFALGEKNIAEEILLEAASKSDNHYWLIRFAHLSSRYQCFNGTPIILGKLKPNPSSNPLLSFKVIELEYLHGDKNKAISCLKTMATKVHRNNLNSYELECLGKTAVKIEDQQLAIDICRQLAKRDKVSNLQALLESINQYLSHNTSQELEHVYSDCISRFSVNGASAQALILFNFTKYLLLTKKEDDWIENLTKEISTADYYFCAQIGKNLVENGYIEDGEKFLNQSANSRGENFGHMEFLGNVYFSANEFARAGAFYDKVLALRPYYRHSWAKFLFCQLPDPIIKSGSIFDAKDLGVIFQEYQGFYNCP